MILRGHVPTSRPFRQQKLLTTAREKKNIEFLGASRPGKNHHIGANEMKYYTLVIKHGGRFEIEFGGADREAVRNKYREVCSGIAAKIITTTSDDQSLINTKVANLNCDIPAIESTGVRVDVTSVDKYNLAIAVNGREIGKAIDCEFGRWVLLIDGELDYDFKEGPQPEFSTLSGCYHAPDYDAASGVAFDIFECNDNVDSTFADGVHVNGAAA